MVDDKLYNKIDIGRIPVMLKSKWCNLAGMREAEMPYSHECLHDQGGYFIVKGTEKVMIAQERQATNHIMVFARKMPDTIAFSSEVRSSIEGSYRAPSALYVRMATDGRRIDVFHKDLAENIPIFAMQRALGCGSDKDMIETCVYQLADVDMVEQLHSSIEAAKDLQFEEAALKYIALRYREDCAKLPESDQLKVGRQFLQSFILPHVGVEEGCEPRKVYFLGYMVHRLLLVSLGRREQDDRDFYGNKRMDMCGALIGQLFRSVIATAMQKSLRPHLDREMKRKTNLNFRDAFAVCVKNAVAVNMSYSLATGNWGVKGRTEGMKTGVSQVLNRLTYSSALSHLRRLNTPIDSSSKQTKPRMLHCTQWGIMCPAETPEGGQCGLVKNLSLLSLASVGSEPQGIIRWLEQNGTETFVDLTATSLARPNAVKIFVNGKWIGVHHNPTPMIKQLRITRRRRVGSSNPVDGDISIVHDIRDRELRIWTDCGRPLRPVFVVENNRIVLTRSELQRAKYEVARAPNIKLWDQLLQGPFIDFLDVEEEDTCLIAMSSKELPLNAYTHCEIHPSMILGICASIIPFSDHNPGTRNTYQSAMGKQAMGIYASNYQLRFDTTAHVLYYPQKPLCRTHAMSYMHSNDLPAGHNAVVAIMCYSGYNQEDSVVMNQSSIDRGFFRSVCYHVYEDEPNPKETYEKPDKTTCKLRRQMNYDLLDKDGLAIPGSTVSGTTDMIFGKTEPMDPTEMEEFTKSDNSVPPKSTELGVVDSVLLTETASKDQPTHRLIKIKIRSIRIPNVGDKFCSRHGQKGTIGITYRMEDMPFNQHGLVPDIIINPHAIPSRMTIAHLVETLAGKSACYQGKEVDSTAFLPMAVQGIAQVLHELKFQRWGQECMHNGHTGLPIDTLVFFGPTYYQRLKHISMDKIHARARGRLLTLTRQPPEGRAHYGGLRFGEMERDCMISHGASQWLKERLFHVSDHYRVMVCDVCGMMCPEHVTIDTKTNTPVYTCRACGEVNKISKVMMPYACKLLFQELMSMSIWTRIRTTSI
jgi:DNA-directed RNA polymerase II subunit RPB2